MGGGHTARYVSFLLDIRKFPMRFGETITGECIGGNEKCIFEVNNDFGAGGKRVVHGGMISRVGDFRFLDLMGVLLIYRENWKMNTAPMFLMKTNRHIYERGS